MADMVRSGTDTPIDFWKNTRSWLLIRGSVSEGIEDNGQGGGGGALGVAAFGKGKKKQVVGKRFDAVRLIESTVHGSTFYLPIQRLFGSLENTSPPPTRAIQLVKPS